MIGEPRDFYDGDTVMLRESSNDSTGVVSGATYDEGRLNQYVVVWSNGEQRSHYPSDLALVAGGTARARVLGGLHG